jgi:hypothetical protein
MHISLAKLVVLANGDTTIEFAGGTLSFTGTHEIQHREMAVFLRHNQAEIVGFEGPSVAILRLTTPGKAETHLFTWPCGCVSTVKTSTNTVVSNCPLRRMLGVDPNAL